MPIGVYPRTEEHRRKRKEAFKGFYPFWLVGKPSKNKGRRHSAEARLKISVAKKGKPSHRKGAVLSDETRRRISTSLRAAARLKPVWNRGMKFPQRSGPNHPRWINDRSKLKITDRRNDPYYSTWRRHVYERDNFKCRIDTADCRGRIEAHHIRRYEDVPELRYEVSNGITLCFAHHPKRRDKEKEMENVFTELVSSPCQSQP